jgi:hypothetical protein
LLRIKKTPDIEADLLEPKAVSSLHHSFENFQEMFNVIQKLKKNGKEI